MPETIDLIFYINIGLVLCVLLDIAADVILLKKTAFMSVAGYVAVALLGVGAVGFTVQLIMHSQFVVGSEYAVYAGLVCMCAGLVASGVYSILLGRKSDKGLCIIAGVLCVAQPVGAIFKIALLFKIKFDTPAESIVYNGYAVTYAALSGIAAAYPAEFTDGAESDGAKPLSSREKKELLKKLKAAAKTPETQFEYGAALAAYGDDAETAASYIMKAAKADYPPAVFNLGYLYENGAGVKRDAKRARECYSRAIALGDRDAKIRLAMIDIKEGHAESAVKTFEEMMSSDPAAAYDYAVCVERGIGTEKNPERAVELYCENIKFRAARARLFALAANAVTCEIDGKPPAVPTKTITDRKYSGETELIMAGLSEVADRHAAFAASKFLEAVKSRGEFEGECRCLVGALYIDCGAKPSDKANGAAYIRSAVGMTVVADDLSKAIGGAKK